MLHQIGLYVHIVAILLAGAGGIGGAIVEHSFWQKIPSNIDAAKTIFPILKTTGKFIITGILLFLLSGLLMLQSVHWVFLSQPWFLVKFGLFLCLPIRAGLIAETAFMHIGSEIQKDQMDAVLLMKLKSKMRRFHLIQYGIVLTIIFLVIFRF
jgi:hypothetical protein